MSDRFFVALGTSSQVPTRRRNHNGYLVRWNAHGFLFDPGEGTQRQMTTFGLAASEVTHIFITHFHGDHCLGLPGIIQRLSLDGARHEVKVYFPASGQKYFDNLLNASIFHNRAHIKPVPITEGGVIERGEGLVIEAYPLEHGVDTYGFRFVEPDKVTMVPERLKAHGLRGPQIGELKRNGFLETEQGRINLADVSVGGSGQSFAFVMDTRVCDNAVRLAQGVDVLICESTYQDSETEDAYQNYHLTARQAAGIAAKAGAAQLVLTHFSQRYHDLTPFETQAREVHPEVVAVQDGQRVAFPKMKRAIEG
ncbi:ribonuclease Z [Acanthopleuribacter pedis]|uniref:Ribonuclease Z n=1 Tax=Acanthopleuribacter pedis TaxID=442870 RepID=A0A8J7QRR6_9BACT|nr:ribonuclease Z [Acanthopleuribacter pedis]MBO1322988.1 ribonuclease Z [Acanthopleuribacter pedis]